ncbi:MAG: NAD(P)/FAD-dependent oxidoreductase [Azospirillaceae bacterium]
MTLPDKSDENRIIIAGAGPVGLVAAIRLAEAGIPCTVLEAEAAPQEDLRASTWHPPTLDMLAPYGLADRLVAAGLVTPTWQIRMHRSGERAEFDLGILADVTDHPFRLQCEQHKFVRLALDWLESHGGVTVRHGVPVASASQDADSVTVSLGGTHAGERLRGRWLIGADGARSTVREALGLSLSGATYPETTILATTRFPFHEHLEGLSNVNYIWSDVGTFSLLRLPGIWRCSLHQDAGESVEEALLPEAIERKLQRIVARPEPYDVEEVRPYRIHRRIVDRYRVGRILLAGDAAHLNSPSGGMGMNGGIHDAFNLTEKLIRVWRGEADDTLLDRYERQRRPIAEEEIIAQADRNRGRMQERDPERRLSILRDLQATIADPVRARAYLLRSSMIEGLNRAAAIQ